MFSSKQRNLIGFDDRWLMAIGIPLCGFVFTLVIPVSPPISFETEYLFRFLIATLFTAFYWTIGRYLSLKVRQKWPQLTQTWTRLTLVMLLLGTIIVLTSSFTCPFLYEKNDVLTYEEFQKKFLLSSIILSLIYSLAILGIYEIAYNFQMGKEALLEAERARKTSLQAQLSNLKTQINPHFLFNSLNTLSSLVEEDSKASQFIQSLSHTYRYILEIKDKELVSLAEEMECIQSYLFLLETRFGDNLRVSIKVPDKYLSFMIPPLSLQILIENATKHNIVSRKKPLFLSIRVNEKGNLEIKNNVQSKIESEPSTGTGLENINSRYRILLKKEIKIIKTENEFLVELPLVQMKPS